MGWPHARNGHMPAGYVIGKELALINPLSRCLSKYFHNT